MMLKRTYLQDLLQDPLTVIEYRRHVRGVSGKYTLNRQQVAIGF